MRFTKYLELEGIITDEFKQKVDDEAKKLATHIRAEIVGAGPRPAHELFEFVYSEPSDILRREEWLLYEELAGREDGDS